MNHKLAIAVTATALLTLAFALLFGSLSMDKNDLDARLRHLSEIALLDSQIDMAALEIKTLDRVDYDRIAALESRLRRVMRPLQGSEPDERALELALRRKLDHVEDLKSRQAIFRNSLSILPVLIDGLKSKGVSLDQSLESALFRSVFATADFDPEPVEHAMDAIRLQIERSSMEESQEWRYLSAHVGKLLELAPEVERLLALTRGLPIAPALDSIRERLIDRREIQNSRSRLSLYGLFLMTLLLLAFALQRGIAVWRQRAMLEIMVRDRTADLEALNADLKREIEEKQLMEQELLQAQKLESIGALSAGIAHEINTPTQYVGDNIDFLKDSFSEVMQVMERVSGLADSAPQLESGRLRELLKGADMQFIRDEVPKAIDDSAKGIRFISSIVRALKDFSHQSGEKTPEDLNRAIESTAAVARNEWKYVAELIIDPDENLRPVPCVLNEFNQVLVNLIVNAAHAISDAVRDSGRTGRITIRTRQRRSHAEIQVEDTGTGIPEEIRHRIFDPFFTTKEIGQGTGQGLSIARRIIVEKHGGTISVDSTVGRGTCFTIRMLSVPEADEPATESEAAATIP